MNPNSFNHTFLGVADPDRILPPLELSDDKKNVRKKKQSGETIIFRDKTALTKLIYGLNASSLGQRGICRSYVRGVFSEIFKSDSDKAIVFDGLIIDLGSPVDADAHKKQTDEISPLKIEENPDDGMLADSDDEAKQKRFTAYQELADNYRREILHAFQAELKARGADLEVGVIGKLHGTGGMYEVYSCNMGNRNMALKVPLPHIRNLNCSINNQNDIELNNKMVEATEGNDNLVRFFGSSKVEDGKGGVYRIDFIEELEGARGLKGYFYDLIGKETDAKSLVLKLTGFFKSVFIPILKGVKGLHDAGIVHRDIKPDNICILETDDGLVVKVGDYDLRCLSGYQSNMGSDISGTPAYTSSERWNKKSITGKSDIYSLGMTLYNLFGGKMPERTLQAALLAIGGFDQSELDIDPGINSIIEKCLRVNPDKRPNIDELIENIQDLISEGIEAEVEPAKRDTFSFKAENPADPIHSAPTMVPELPLFQPIAPVVKPSSLCTDTLVDPISFSQTQSIDSLPEDTDVKHFDPLPFIDTELRIFDRMDQTI